MNDRTGLLHRVLGWLRAGYPEGVPRSDYVALLAVLHRHLTETEIAAVAAELAQHTGHTGITAGQIADAITRYAKERPDPEDITRVAAHLATGGWQLTPPLAAPPPQHDEK